MCNLVCFLFWVPCIALYITNVETRRLWKKLKPSPSPRWTQKHSPMGLCAVWCGRHNVTKQAAHYCAVWSLGWHHCVMGMRARAAHGLSQAFAFGTCPDLDLPTVHFCTIFLLYYWHSGDLNCLEAPGKLWVRAVRVFLHLLHHSRSAGVKITCLV